MAHRKRWKVRIPEHSVEFRAPGVPDAPVLRTYLIPAYEAILAGDTPQDARKLGTRQAYVVCGIYGFRQFYRQTYPLSAADRYMDEHDKQIERMKR